MYPSAVIFDFDGVIVDTEPLHYRSFQHVLEPQKLGFSWDDYIKTYMGFDDRDAFREVYCSTGRELKESELNRLIKIKAEKFQQIIAEGVTAYPGVVVLIQQLDNNGIPLAICSGALLCDIMPILKTLDIEKYFRVVVTAEDVQKSKPDPACYLMAREKIRETYSEKLACDAEITAIEDTPAGISAAKGAGLTVFAVKNSYPEEQLKAADRIITSLEELISGF